MATQPPAPLPFRILAHPHLGYVWVKWEPVQGRDNVAGVLLVAQEGGPEPITIEVADSYLMSCAAEGPALGALIGSAVDQLQAEHLGGGVFWWDVEGL